MGHNTQNIASYTNRREALAATFPSLALVLLAFGVFLIVQLLAGVITLTQLFLFYMIAPGIASFFTSLQLNLLARSWSGFLLSGIVDGLLIVVIIVGWPDTSH